MAGIIINDYMDLMMAIEQAKDNARQLNDLEWAFYRLQIYASVVRAIYRNWVPKFEYEELAAKAFALEEIKPGR